MHPIFEVFAIILHISQKNEVCHILKNHLGNILIVKRDKFKFHFFLKTLKALNTNRLSGL